MTEGEEDASSHLPNEGPTVDVPDKDLIGTLFERGANDSLSVVSEAASHPPSVLHMVAEVAHRVSESCLWWKRWRSFVTMIGGVSVSSGGTEKVSSVIETEDFVRRVD